VIAPLIARLIAGRWTDDRLTRVHRWAVRYASWSPPVVLVLCAVGLWRDWLWLAPPAAVLLAGWPVAFYGACLLCHAEAARRGWVVPEWTPGRRLGPFTWHRPGAVERDGSGPGGGS
jgi:hypothetical protein